MSASQFVKRETFFYTIPSPSCQWKLHFSEGYNLLEANDRWYQINFHMGEQKRKWETLNSSLCVCDRHQSHFHDPENWEDSAMY